MKPRIYTVYNDQGNAIWELDPREACEPAPPCGGCEACMLKQAEHSGMRIESREIPFRSVLELLYECEKAAVHLRLMLQFHLMEMDMPRAPYWEDLDGPFTTLDAARESIPKTGDPEVAYRVINQRGKVLWEI